MLYYPDGSKQQTRFLPDAGMSPASAMRFRRVLACLADSIQWIQSMRAMVVVAIQAIRQCQRRSPRSAAPPLATWRSTGWPWSSAPVRTHARKVSAGVTIRIGKREDEGVVMAASP